jgi:predicted DNA-binding transcriptional regulator YafY
MNFTKLKTLVYLHELIDKKATDNPKQLAKKLGVCERIVYNYIEILKDMGAPILYCFATESYCYEHLWQLDKSYPL